MAGCTPAGQSAAPPESSANDSKPVERAEPASTANAESDSIEPATQESNGPTADSGEVAARIESWESTQQIISQQRGKVVVLDLWSTSCVPCRREFPRLVALQKSHPEDVVCISFSLDYIGLAKKPPDVIKPKVLTFLQEQDAQLLNIISSDPDEEIYDKLDLAAIPAVLVYDQTGELTKRFDNEEAATAEEEFTYEKDVVPFVEQLVRDAN